MNAPAEQPVSLDRFAKAYVKLRDARSAAKKVWEEADLALKLKQERLEVEMLKFLNDHQIESMRTAAGTVYRQEEIQPSCADWTALYAWIAENDAFDCLERRVKKTFVKEYMEQHNGERPPGVNVMREYVVRVRRS